MKRKLGTILCVISLILIHCNITNAQEMDKMWGDKGSVKQVKTESKQKHLFEWGNYAMFIHWGLYSQLGNCWKGKTYYGIGEWMMNGNMAGIPVDEYKATAKTFNPTSFNAHAIAQLAKDAGMKYIIITSKHHDGFAMFDSKACDFNIVKCTPFARDPMKELSKACKELGLGFGFYYSHNQDWTYPGGNNGPQTDALGNKKTFEDYFKEKCLPQVEEITKNYGDIELVWFDTPGNMPIECAKKLVEVVHRNQPNALVSGRVGYDLGDYKTLGDMEVPLENVDGMWESVDVTNDSWGYAWYDQNWKTPKQVLMTLISTIGRGGTLMMNVGPDGMGRIPERAQTSLRSAGKWIAAHPQVIYGAGPSPWRHALPWGDVTTNNGKLYISVYHWPISGKLYIPGIHSDMREARLMEGKQHQRLSLKKEGSWLVVNTPMSVPNSLVSVIELTPVNTNNLSVDSIQAVDPDFGTEISAKFATVKGGNAYKKYWMEKFGEWKTAFVVEKWTPDTSVSWQFEVKKPGMYQIGLKYTGDSRLAWSVDNEEGQHVQNQQGASSTYDTHPLGWMKFTKAGKHQLTVRLLEGKMESVSLQSIDIKYIDF